MTNPLAAANRLGRTERRSTHRVSLDVGATLHKESFFCAGRVSDVSEGGACIQTAAELAVGSPLAMAFPLDDEVVMARGEIVWVRGGSVGVSFSYLSPFDGKAISKYCRRNRARVSTTVEV